MSPQSIVDALVVFSFLVVFAVDDLQTRRVENKKTVLFCASVFVLVVARYRGIPDSRWLITTGLCFVALTLMYTNRMYGGADYKITAIISMIYGPVACAYLIISIMIGYVWGKLVVRDGFDRAMKIPWHGIPVLYFYMYVFGFSEIILSTIRTVL